MSDFLAEQIIASAEPVGASSTFNRQTLIDVGDSLKTNPWIRKVRQRPPRVFEEARRYDRDRLRVSRAAGAGALERVFLAGR